MYFNVYIIILFLNRKQILNPVISAPKDIKKTPSTQTHMDEVLIKEVCLHIITIKIFLSLLNTMNLSELFKIIFIMYIKGWG